ncbi:MAG: cation:proton antiporter [Chitinispirillaceae bacterium]|nr:cation:proton antiporter [Chitinispirillaceae bacterium]
MNSVTVLGLVISVGFLLGECAVVVRLPKVMGYIVAGLILNPSITPLLPIDFIRHTQIPTDIALSFITFAVGGALSFKTLKNLGRSIALITVFEAQTALLFTAAGLALFGWFFPPSPHQSWLHTSLPAALLFGALACPTDPSATLAVIHQYKATGKVSYSILGVAGLDDIAGLTNFTILSSLAITTAAGIRTDMTRVIGSLSIALGGAVVTGAVFGSVIAFGLRFLRRETEGAQIVVIFACLMLCFGLAKTAGFEELLATMTAGIVVSNFSRYQRRAFEMLERYTDELIFVYFFTVSAMRLNFTALSSSLLTVVFFILFRSCGKVCGTLIGGALSRETVHDSLLISLGLIPQGGIVIGLALTLASRPQYRQFADTILAVIIGATIVHEIAGPLLSTVSLKLSGETNQDKPNVIVRRPQQPDDN